MEAHAHHERNGATGGFQRPLLIALWITAVVMIAEFVGGLLANSLALLSDAAHMLTDIAALLLGIVAFQFSTKPPTNKTTFGFHRLEIFAAQINGGVLVFLSFFIFYAAYQRLLQPEPIKGPLMLVVACVGLVANIVGILVLHKTSRENLNVKAAFLHIVGDLISSVGVIIGGIIISLTGWFPIDHILSIMIGLIILKGAYSVVKETAAILLEAVPKHIDLDKLIQEVKAMEGVKSFHDVHVWTITSGLYALSGHVQIQDQQISESTRILEVIQEYLRQRYKINHPTLQLECHACEPDRVCSLATKPSSE
ncbi:MAG: cation diffusion facilitator family transporter [Deltaproteobacteria bacterium]|nr:cation diffusion facilitator family transporter [Deltaproteobacteria bacterium]